MLHIFFLLMPRAGIEPATQGFSVLCSTNWAIWARVAGTGFEPMTFGLWARRASRLLHPALFSYSSSFSMKNGQRWIRTTEACCSRFTVCPLWPLGNLPIYLVDTFVSKPMIGLEPITCWLQISCSANWATSAYLSLNKKNGTNRARTCDPLLVRQVLSQLSYDPRITTPAGLEPATSAVTGRRSNQLSHEAL